MAITLDDFDKVWASESPLTPYEFSESQYKEGWNFIGGTPPSRQMWDFIQKQNDEKLKYLLNNFDDYAKKTDLDDYLPLAGGTLTGDVLGVTPPNGDNSKKLATTEFVAKSLAGARVLPGTVTAFSGTFKDGYPVNKNTGLVDKEWHLCDGTNGTPDLRNRFIYGGNGTNSGATGGEASHTLTEAELPSISGTCGSRTGDEGGIFEHPATGCFSYQDPIKGKTYQGYGDGSESWFTYRTAKLSFGGNQPHNNMPPYYTLAYIMKL